MNNKESYISIEVSYNNPTYSALITNSTYSILQSKIIDHRIKSSKEHLDYTIKNYKLKEGI